MRTQQAEHDNSASSASEGSAICQERHAELELQCCRDYARTDTSLACILRGRRTNELKKKNKKEERKCVFFGGVVALHGRKEDTHTRPCTALTLHGRKEDEADQRYEDTNDGGKNVVCLSVQPITAIGDIQSEGAFN